VIIDPHSIQSKLISEHRRGNNARFPRIFAKTTGAGTRLLVDDTGRLPRPTIFFAMVRELVQPLHLLSFEIALSISRP
jgi:hypothetical protein